MKRPIVGSFYLLIDSASAFLLNAGHRFACSLKRAALFALFAILFVAASSSPVLAAAKVASASGLWNSTTVWGGAAVPIAGDTVTINSGVNVTVNVPSTCDSIVINAPAAATGISINTGQLLNVSGAITMNAPTAAFTGQIAVVGTGILNAGSIAINGGGTINWRSLVTVATGTINVSGNITFGGTAAQAQLTFTGAGTLKVGGSLGAGGTFTPNTGTVNYSSVTGGQTIQSAYTYYGLKISNTSGINTAGGALTVNTGALTTTAGGFLDMGTYRLIGTFSVVNAGTIKTSCPTATSALPLPPGKTWTGTGTIEYAGATAQTVMIGTYSGNLVFSGAGAKTASAVGTITVGGFWNTSVGTAALNTNNNTMTVAGDVTGSGAISQGSGILSIGGAWSNNGTYTAGTGAVRYSSTTGGQTVRAVTYYALTLSNSSGTNTAAGNITINTGALTTTNGGFFDMGTYQLLGTFTSANAGTIRTACTAVPPITSGKTWTGAGTVEFYSASGQTVPIGTYSGNLVFSGAGTKTTAAGLVTVGGFWSVNDGNADLSANNTNITLSTATTGQIIGTGNITCGSGMISLGGNWLNSGTFTCGTGTVEYAGLNVAQTIAALTYNNLTIRKNSSYNNIAAGNITVGGTLLLSPNTNAYLNMQTYQLFGAFNATNNTGTIQTQNLSTTPVPTGKTWGGTVNYNATTGGQTIVTTSTTYNNLTIGNSSGSSSPDGDLTVNGVLTNTTGGTFDMGTNQLLGTLSSISNSGTIKTQNTSATPIPTGKTWSTGNGTVEYNASSGGQTIMTGTYYNLLLSNTSGTQTTTGNLTVSNILSISNGSTLDMGTYQILGTLNYPIIEGILRTQCTINPAAPTLNTWGGTGSVNFDATTGGQYIPNGTYNCNINLTNTSGLQTFLAGVFTINGTLSIAGSAGEVDFLYTGASTINTLSVGAPMTLGFAAASNTTITNFTAVGSSGNVITLESLTTSPFTLTKAGGGTASGDYLSVSNGKATPVSTWYAAHSINGGSNSGWIFTGSSSNTSSTEVWVSPTGSDVDGDGTIGNPFQKFATALSFVAASGNIKALGGTYYEDDIAWPNKNNIKLMPEPTNTSSVIIDAQSLGRIFTVEAAVNMTIEGVTMQNGKITTAGLNGGGIYLPSNTRLWLNDVTIQSCTAENGTGIYGGAIYCPSTNPATIYATSSQFLNNRSYVGGVSAYATWYVSNCIFSNNVAPTGAGGVVFAGTWVATNCVFSKNVSGASGGGVAYSVTAPGFSAINCTFYKNSASASGGVFATGTYNVKNCIFWGNSGGANTPVFALAPASAKYCDIQPYTGWPAATANISVEPQFISTAEPYNLRLNSNSPCINTATLEGAPSDDFDGNSRPLPNDGVSFDMGAYEYNPDAAVSSIVYISPYGDDTTGTGDYGSPYKTLQRGLNMVLAGGEVRMLPGVYTIATSEFVNDSMANWPDKNNVTIKLSPEATEPATIDALATGRVFNVAYPLNITLESISIVNGYQRNDSGGAIKLVSNVNLDLKNVKFIDCVVRSPGGYGYVGGSIYCQDTTDNIKARNCSFTGGYAFNDYSDSGGAGVGYSGTWDIADCYFAHNMSQSGGIFAGSIATINNSVIIGEVYNGYGGAFNGCTLSLNNNIFKGTFAAFGGVAINSTVTATNCVFSNCDTLYGGAIAIGGTWTGTNSIYWDCDGSDGLFSSTIVDITYSDMGPGAGYFVAGTGNISVEPGFISIVEGDAGFYKLGMGSRCIDSGLSDGSTLDAAGNPRALGLGSDMGVYEFQGPSVRVDSPNGGETYLGGDDITITWIATDELYGIKTDSINILYSSNGGTSWSSVALGQPNSGIYTWEAPAIGSTQYLISVEATNANEVSNFDISNNEFTITTEVWVSTSGSDTPGNGTISNPFATVGFALTKTISGGIVNVFGGTYNEYNISWPNIADITLKASLETTPVTIDAGSAGRVINVANAQTLTIEGITLQNGYLNSGSGACINMASGSALYLTNSIIQYCTDEAGGVCGAIYSEGCTVNAQNSSFIGNSAPNGYPGVAQGGTWNASNCTFKYNSAAWGAVARGSFTDNDRWTATNCTFAYNKAFSGVAICNDVKYWTGVNCAFYGNDSGGSLAAFDEGYFTLTNSIYWGNAGGTFSREQATPSVNYSDFQGSYSGTGNIDSDPLFVSTDSSSSDFLKLGMGSPCIDSGTETGAPLVDLAGISRPKGAGYDMGIYEFQGSSVRVVQPNGGELVIVDAPYQVTFNTSPDVTDVYIRVSSNNGSSWTEISHEAWTHSGVCTFEWTPSVSFVSTDCLISVEVFDGTSWNLDSSDAKFEVLAAALPKVHNDTQGTSYMTIQAALDAANAGDLITLEAWTYSGAGNYSIIWPNTNDIKILGLGMGLSTIDALGMGRVISVESAVNLTIEGITIYNGANVVAGGGIYLPQSSNLWLKKVNMNHCSVRAGAEWAMGGAIFTIDDTTNIYATDCIFSSNVAYQSDWGGGQGAVIFGGKCVVTNCIFNDNNADWGYGGVAYGYGLSSPFTAINCTFYHNVARAGGVIAYYGESNLTNCILSNNYGSLGDNMCFYGSASYPIRYCVLQTNSFVYGTGNTTQDPRFKSINIGDADYLMLGAGSAAIDGGTIEAGMPLYDLAGNARPHGLGMDIGVYEYQGPGIKVFIPNGGEIYGFGQVVTITWAAADEYGLIGTPPITINGSTNEGASWFLITNEANSGFYTWEAAGILSEDCLVSIEVVNGSNESNYDASDAVFIVDRTPPIVVNSPSESGLTLEGGFSYDITWTATEDTSFPPYGYINIYFSTNEGAGWTEIYGGLYNNVTATTGAIAWDVPNVYASGCFISVEAIDIANNKGYGISTYPFSIIGPVPVVYVSPSGSDTYPTGDGSEPKPYYTIGKAFKRVADNSGMIYLKSGLYDYEYSDDVDMLLWPYKDYLTLKLAPGETQPATIDAQNARRVILCQYSLTLSIEGIAIQNGLSPSYQNGGGIDCSAYYTVLGLKDVSINNCNASIYGGGIYLSGYACEYDLTNVSINNCTAGYNGGGIYVSYDGLSHLNNVSINNCNASYGGGVCFGGYSGEHNFTNVSIKNCNASIYGGGIYMLYGTLNLTSGEVSSCTVDNSSVDYRGGAVFSNYASITANGCIFNGNNAASLNWGGAIAGGDWNVANCIFSNNTADWGAVIGTGYMTANNCAFVNNTAYTDGGVADYISYFSGENNIFWGNTCGAQTETYPTCPVFSSWISPNSVDISYCDIQPDGWELGGNGGTPRGVITGTGNISAEPNFVNSSSDYHLAGGSPCIDSGTVSYDTPTIDYDGNVRPHGLGVDMGPYEFQGPSVRVEYPNGGELLTAGTMYPITFGVSPDVTDVYVRVSSDGGNSWTEITHEAWVHTGTCTYEWIPTNGFVSTECMISVEVSDGSIWNIDTNNYFFEIEVSVAPESVPDVATRFYLPSTGAAEVLPAFSAWDNINGADRIRCVINKVYSGFATKGTDPDGASGIYLNRQYVSDPIAPQTISGYVSGEVRGNYSGIVASPYSEVTIKIVSNDGQTIRGTLLDLTNGITTYSASLKSRWIPVCSALTPVAAESGDRIVIEIGTNRGAGSSTPTIYQDFGDNSTTDEAENVTVQGNPWIGFSQKILFPSFDIIKN